MNFWIGAHDTRWAVHFFFSFFFSIFLDARSSHFHFLSFMLSFRFVFFFFFIVLYFFVGLFTCFALLMYTASVSIFKNFCWFFSGLLCPTLTILLFKIKYIFFIIYYISDCLFGCFTFFCNLFLSQILLNFCILLLHNFLSLLFDLLNYFCK